MHTFEVFVTNRDPNRDASTINILDKIDGAGYVRATGNHWRCTERVPRVLMCTYTGPPILDGQSSTKLSIQVLPPARFPNGQPLGYDAYEVTNTVELLDEHFVGVGTWVSERVLTHVSEADRAR